MSKKIALFGLAVLCALGIIVNIHISSASSGSEREKQTNADLSLLKVTSEGVTIEFDPPKDTTGMLEAELYELGGKLLAKVIRRHKGKPLQIELIAQIDKKDLASYYLRYRFDSSRNFARGVYYSWVKSWRLPCSANVSS